MSIVLHLTTIFYYLSTKFSLGRILFPMRGEGGYMQPLILCVNPPHHHHRCEISFHIFERTDRLDDDFEDVEKSLLLSCPIFFLDLWDTQKNLEEEDPPLLFRWFPRFFLVVEPTHGRTIPKRNMGGMVKCWWRPSSFNPPFLFLIQEGTCYFIFL